MSVASIDLTKLSPDQIQALEDAGAISIPAEPAAPAPAPANSPAPQPVLGPSGSSPAPVLTGQPVPAGLPTQIMSAVGEIGQVLATGVAGSGAAKAGTVAELAAGVGSVIWQLFNPHTGKTSQHASLGEAVNAAALDMHVKQSHAVETKQTNVAATITPVVRITAADVANMPTPAVPQNKPDPAKNY